MSEELKAIRAERDRAQLACQQIAERLTAAEARAEAAEAALVRLVRAAMTGNYRDWSGLNIVSHPAYQNAYVFLTCDEAGNTIRSLPPIPRTGDAARTLKGTPDGR